MRIFASFFEAQRILREKKIKTLNSASLLKAVWQAKSLCKGIEYFVITFSLTIDSYWLRVKIEKH